MLPVPMIAVLIATPFLSVGSPVVYLVGEQPEGLIRADPVDGLPVLGDESVLDAEEVGRHEVRSSPGLGDGPVPDTSRGDSVILGDRVGLEGAAIGHGAAADPQSAGGRVASVG